MQIENPEYRILAQNEQIIVVNEVLRKTYFLLSVTLLFSAVVAWLTMVGILPAPGMLLTLIGSFGLMFLAQNLANSRWGLFAVFAFTGFMGYTIAPLLSYYCYAFTNGKLLVLTALGGTGLLFTLLSFYVLLTKKNFTYLSGFLFAAVVMACLASLANLFLNIPILPIIIASAFILISAGLILLQTSAIVHGGERNYILATISLYVSLFNLFTSLLQLLGFFAGEKE